MNIAIISGSPRKTSITYRVALFLEKYLRKTTTHSVKIIDVRDWQLPHLQEVWMSEAHAPEVFKPLAKAVFETDAFLLVSPEFNGSYSPALKNLLDHFPKQYRKAFGIVTASPGIMGGMRASQQMQLLVGALFGLLAPHMLITPQVENKFDSEGNLIDPSFQKSIDVFVKEFLWLAESLSPELVAAYN